MQPERGVDYPSPSITGIEEKVELYAPTPPLGLLVLF